MNVITRKKLRDYALKHADAAGPLASWHRVVRAARWASIRDVRLIYATADAVTVKSGRIVTVFNIGGNKYRLVTAIHYNRQRVYVRLILTHAEYDKGTWKNTQ